MLGHWFSSSFQFTTCGSELNSLGNSRLRPDFGDKTADRTVFASKQRTGDPLNLPPELAVREDQHDVRQSGWEAVRAKRKSDPRRFSNSNEARYATDGFARLRGTR